SDPGPGPAGGSGFSSSGGSPAGAPAGFSAAAGLAAGGVHSSVSGGRFGLPAGPSGGAYRYKANAPPPHAAAARTRNSREKIPGGRAGGSSVGSDTGRLRVTVAEI